MLRGSAPVVDVVSIRNGWRQRFSNARMVAPVYLGNVV